MKVLFLAVATGGGHLKAAKALSEYIQTRDFKSETLIIDTLKYANPLIDKLIVKTYINTLKTTPKIYGKLYNITDEKELLGDNINDFSNSVNRLFSFKVKKLIQEFKPDIIVCTHPFSLQMVLAIKKKIKINVPIVDIITDYAIHNLGIRNGVDAYVIPHEFLINDAISRGISRDKLFSLGIPVENKFLSTTNKSGILQKFGLVDTLTFLVMGGSLGFGEIEDIFIKLLKCDRPIQIVVVTGTNKKLKAHLEKQTKHLYGNKNIVILSYVNEVNELMEVSDFIITKPGGLTISESLIKSLPIAIISPIPGQEERNANFLINCGVAARITEHDNINSFLNQVVDNTMRVSSMKQIAKTLAKPNACHDIYKLMCKLINNTKN